MSRLLVYNIAYATGAPKNYTEHILKMHRYINRANKNIIKIAKFIRKSKIDIAGLVEIDTGSITAMKKNQALTIGRITKNYNSYYTTKYGDNITSKLIPILRKQGNAIITKYNDTKGNYHYFPGGFKKLIIQLETKDFSFLLVHLALSKKIREIQLNYLIDLLSNREKPFIIGGDFNTFGGVKELTTLKKELNIIDPNTKKIPTFPSWAPKHQLDFILCSREIKVKKFDILDIKLSDHLPLILDFELDNRR